MTLNACSLWFIFLLLEKVGGTIIGPINGHVSSSYITDTTDESIESNLYDNNVIPHVTPLTVRELHHYLKTHLYDASIVFFFFLLRVCFIEWEIDLFYLVLYHYIEQPFPVMFPGTKSSSPEHNNYDSKLEADFK